MQMRTPRVPASAPVVGRTVRTPRLDAAGDPRFAVLALQRAAGNRATVAALRGRVGGGPAVLARDKKPAKVCDSPGFARKVTIQPVFFKSGENDKSPTGVSWKKRFD